MSLLLDYHFVDIGAEVEADRGVEVATAIKTAATIVTLKDMIEEGRIVEKMNGFIRQRKEMGRAACL